MQRRARRRRSRAARRRSGATTVTVQPSPPRRAARARRARPRSTRASCCGGQLAGGGGGGAPRSREPDSAHEVGDQPRLPVRPGGRAGGQRVGLGQRVQQVEDVGDRRPRRRPPRWSPGRRGRAGWRSSAAAGAGAPAARAIVDVRRRRSPSAARRPRRAATPASLWSPRPALADVVQQRADQQQVGPGHPARSAPPPARRPRPGAGRR